MLSASSSPVDAALADRLISAALAGGGDHAEVFTEMRRSRSLRFEEGRVKAATLHVASGVAIRVLCGEAQGLAYCETGQEADMLVAARTAASVAQRGGPGHAHPVRPMSLPSRYPVEQALGSVDVEARIRICRRMDAEARRLDDAVQWISASLSDSERTIQVATSDGTWVEDYQPSLRMTVLVALRDGDRRERGHRALAAQGGFELAERHDPEAMARAAVRLGRLRLDAAPCPAGTMPVVLGSGGGAGVLVHEAVGHGLEADFNRRGSSAYSGLIGQRVAAEGVTIIDGGSGVGEPGALNVDDEGSPVEEAVLIERGVLRGYMTDRVSARLMGLKATGSGRRESYRHLPQPRMRITTMAAGSADPEDIVRSVDRGLYCAQLGGGSVDIATGDFNFEVTEAYLIEGGRIGQAVRGATLMGNGPEAMRRVSMVGTDARTDPGGWVCGKNGQGVPVSLGTPTFKVDELVVGGEGT